MARPTTDCGLNGLAHQSTYDLTLKKSFLKGKNQQRERNDQAENENHLHLQGNTIKRARGKMAMVASW